MRFNTIGSVGKPAPILPGRLPDLALTLERLIGASESLGRRRALGPGDVVTWTGKNTVGLLRDQDKLAGTEGKAQQGDVEEIRWLTEPEIRRVVLGVLGGGLGRVHPWGSPTLGLGEGGYGPPARGARAPLGLGGAEVLPLLKGRCTPGPRRAMVAHAASMDEIHRSSHGFAVHPSVKRCRSGFGRTLEGGLGLTLTRACHVNPNPRRFRLTLTLRCTLTLTRVVRLNPNPNLER